jgi:hypothetical protein
MKKRLALLVLGCGLGVVPVARAQEQAKMDLLLAAKTICYSGESQVTWNKKATKPDTQAILYKMLKAASTAMKPYRVSLCESGPDLVLRINYDDMDEFLWVPKILARFFRKFWHGQPPQTIPRPT